MQLRVLFSWDVACFHDKSLAGDSPAHVGSGQAVLKKVDFYLAQYSHLGIEIWDTYVIAG